MVVPTTTFDISRIPLPDIAGAAANNSSMDQKAVVDVDLWPKEWLAHSGFECQAVQHEPSQR